ncbi:ribosomal protein eL42-like, partial [Erinaceus europaeus]|uniref:Ribosomal protein eL42-like n=1 Tax=Erinaceus europaeus TaxID=9365 RepID=A0ABM3WF50_ERIEU
TAAHRSLLCTGSRVLGVLVQLLSFLFHFVDKATLKIGNEPKTQRTFCKRCGKHQRHKVAQSMKGKDFLCAQGRRRCDCKQSGYSGQTGPISQEAKTTKKAVLRLTCVEPNCRSKGMLAIKTCKLFELGGGKKRKGGPWA